MKNDNNNKKIHFPLSKTNSCNHKHFHFLSIMRDSVEQNCATPLAFCDLSLRVEPAALPGATGGSSPDQRAPGTSRGKQSHGSQLQSSTKGDTAA